ncbi:chromate transporter [Agromyces indicus]|uniref:Chromate transporter n=1 Tax=Agromyces indicus TaxID=758919 RepID=A0ABU1FH20_9MICO|nr:chromate transporter [Agromyces indicus]MDR5690585.1 chromate transporter [Agromyces indicus]
MGGWLRQLAAMLKVGVIGFGGGSALIPVMEKELVRPGRLSDGEFVQDTVIANITPGALPVKLAALSGARLGGSRLSSMSALVVALPGTAATVALLALFAQLGPGAIRSIEFASLGVTAFILYLLAHYVVKVLAPEHRVRTIPIVIAVIAFLAGGAGKTVELGQELIGVDAVRAVPELSALGLVLVALVAISILSLWQYLRRHRVDESDSHEPRPGQIRRAIRSVVMLAGMTAVGLSVSVLVPPAGDTLRFLGLVLASTVTSFGGGEAYVGVADGFFVAGGDLESSVFYGQIVPVANALPGPILVKIAAGIGYVLGGEAGLPAAIAAFLVAVGSCSAIAVAVLAGYDRARNSLLVRNVSTYIMPVICGLLASTSVAMLQSNVRIAEEAGAPAGVTVLASIALAALVPLVRIRLKVPDIVFIVVFGTLSLAILEVI